MTIKDQVKKIGKEISPALVEIRRYIHQNPELSFQEFETTQYLRSHLQKIDVTVLDNYAETGVVGLLTGNRSGPVVALRGDIDALPLKEKTGLPFS